MISRNNRLDETVNVSVLLSHRRQSQKVKICTTAIGLASGIPRAYAGTAKLRH